MKRNHHYSCSPCVQLCTPMLLLTSLLAVFSAVHSCDDVNTAACQQLDHVLDVCTHPCFSTLCQRCCGKCPLKCYHCLSTNPTDCSVTEECQSMEYACIQERFLTNNFTVGHKRGCVHIQVCHQLYGATCQNGGECRDHRGFCCRTDLCNKVTSSQRVGPSNNIQHKDHTRTANNVNDTTVCHDVDPTSCKMIINTKRDACNTSCFQQQCPRSCGLCVECSSCNNVDLPEHCNTTTICDPGEKCYTLKTRSTEGIIRYKLGCLHENGCNTLHESLSTVVGRSDSIDITIGGHCCTGNLCNVVKPTKPPTYSYIYRPSNTNSDSCGGSVGRRHEGTFLQRKGRSFTWRDCVPASTAHPFITFTSVSVSPSPVVLPGCFTVGVQATIHHHFGRDVGVVVKMDKKLLGAWTKVPCANNLGSCYYDNPCEFLSAVETSGTCPTQLETHGLPCTCPFNPTNINLPPSVFHVPQINPAWEWFLTGRFRVQAEMIHGHDIVGCFHVEMDIKRHGGGGFLFG